ncbi:hypothetical protein BKA56DRAFT_600222 [Ilyonectria sp. MPI-CAGE-AT-0026]|nr:hypothetical protein BKA56DRAFT_600222 [Ilyonectria sp. MPI-CAGE-AT-0026]
MALLLLAQITVSELLRWVLLQLDIFTILPDNRCPLLGVLLGLYYDTVANILLPI